MVLLCGSWSIIGGIAGIFILSYSIIQHGLASSAPLLLINLYLAYLFAGLLISALELFKNNRRFNFALMIIVLLLVPVVQSNTVTYKIFTPMTFYFIYSDSGGTKRYNSETKRVETKKNSYLFRVVFLPQFSISIGGHGKLLQVGVNIIPLISFFVFLRHYLKSMPRSTKCIPNAKYHRVTSR